MTLGAPLVTIELTNNQLDLCINNAVELFSENVNLHQNFLALNLSAYVEDVGIALPSSVMSVFSLQGSVLTSVGGDGLFTTFNAMLNSGSFDIIFNPAGFSWIGYEIAMQYLDTVNKMLGKGFDFDYNTQTKILKLYPDPKKANMTGYLVLGVFSEQPEAEYLGRNYVKRLAVAEAKILLGTIRTKFTGVQLLGGGTVDGSAIKAEGIAERDKLIEEIQTQFNGPIGFFVG